MSNIIKHNERDWSGQIIGWIKEAILSGRTAFQEVSNDTGIKTLSNRTKFPDILLFTDKRSGVVFNGWELKFPDTEIDDRVMLENALEKAKALSSGSFVTWNGAEAIIWKVDESDYTIQSLTKLKVYPKIPTISSRKDMADPMRYAANEEALKNRCFEIIHDLDQLYKKGELCPAVNISGNVTEAIQRAASIIIPQFVEAIRAEVNSSPQFRNAFAKWKIYEGTTLSILGNSSRRKESINAQEILAKFTFYNLIGKIVFYYLLSENLSGELEPILLDRENVRTQLNAYFDKAKGIDYQAVFQPYFTDILEYSNSTEEGLIALINVLSQYDFHLLPTEVIGTILENLVPSEERQKFGQYFTPETLANLVAFPVVQTNKSLLFDPTSGTGTFLNAFYKILNFRGTQPHITLLEQIWGNDISHFPAILSVINLYKQNVSVVSNFPKITRENFFNLEVNAPIDFPDPIERSKRITYHLPLFDGIASNFPFIQQEDIPNKVLSKLFKEKFGKSQTAFLKDNEFKINERSDYFTYCVYNAFRFLKPEGMLSAITSNAWLGKEYGKQFKSFLIQNFHIKYIVRSTAEHWFKQSQVSTIFFVLERSNLQQATKFVTLNTKLDSLFSGKDDDNQFSQIETFYEEIDHCEDVHNPKWRKNVQNGRYDSVDGTLSVCVVPFSRLKESIEKDENWSNFFFAPDMFGNFVQFLTPLHPTIAKVIRGERTGWNDMFLIDEKNYSTCSIAPEYLCPYIKSSSELSQIEFQGIYKNKIFVCNASLDQLDSGTFQWIEKFKGKQNRNGSKTIEQACADKKPFWYSLHPKTAHIITSINPNTRWFFSFSKVPFMIDQRLIALQVQEGYDVELIAALLNSALTFLWLELRGTERNLGVLDLNADYLKNMKILNPHLLSDKSKQKIVTAFQALKSREIQNVEEEVKLPDRRNFDKTILRSFGIDVSILDEIYNILVKCVKDRVEMRKR